MSSFYLEVDGTSVREMVVSLRILIHGSQQPELQSQAVPIERDLVELVAHSVACVLKIVNPENGAESGAEITSSEFQDLVDDVSVRPTAAPLPYPDPLAT
jgi:hypothetical protein